MKGTRFTETQLVAISKRERVRLEGYGHRVRFSI